MPLNFITPDLLYEEELLEHHPELKQLGLKVSTLNPHHIKYSFQLVGQYSKNSTYDLFALALAKQENCLLLTGDFELRKAAKSENISVSGTLWIIEELFNQKQLSISQCYEAYSKMKESGRKLPWDIVEEQLNRFDNFEGKR